MGNWENRDERKLESVYQQLNIVMNGRQSLAAPPASHYAGAFGFQSLLITTKPLVERPQQKELESVRAHEAFHGYQAMVFQSVRELFRALQAINRKQMLTLGQMMRENIRIKPGQTVFEAGRGCSDKVFSTPFKSLDSSISTLEKALEPVAGVNVFDLIEGSAAAVEILTREGNQNSLSHFSLAPIMNELRGVYGNAWQLYRQRGGSSAAVFALLCCTSLRYGSVSPPNFDNLASPQEIFEYYCRFGPYFDSYLISEKAMDSPDYFSEMPLGNFPDPDFNPRRVDHPKDEWDDYPPVNADAHHFPDEMFEDEVASALESYKDGRTQDQLRIQDNLFGVSMALATAAEAVYVRIGPPIEEEQSSGKGRMIYDQVANRIHTLLPGIQIEEVLLRAITQPNFQSRLASIFETEVSKLQISPWHDSDHTISHAYLVELFDLAQIIESISIAEAADKRGDQELFNLMMPNCCTKHQGQVRTLRQLVACNAEGSISSRFQKAFECSFSDIWSS